MVDTPLKWALNTNDDNITLKLSGQLSRYTLSALWHNRNELLAKGLARTEPFIWDLEALTHIDSAGFALLCELIHQLDHNNTYPQKIIHIPPQLLTLAELFGLSTWITPLLQQHGTNDGTATN